MRVPVPTDWDGQTYQCIELRWPDSAQWDHILAGLLTGIARGYFWDVPDKAANDAQKAAALAILARNLPFHSCATQPDQQNDIDAPRAVFGGPGGNSESEEIDDMPGVTWLEWEAGQLYMYFGPCCKVAVEGTMPRGSTSDIEGNNPYDGAVDPETGLPYTGTACGKASAVVEAVWLALTDLVNGAWSPSSVVGAITGSQPGVSFDRLDLWRAYLAYVATELTDAVDPLGLLGWNGGSGLWDTSNILDPLRKATYKCRLAQRFTSETTMTNAELEILRSEARGLWSVGVAMAVEHIINAFGDGDLKSIGAAGAIQEANCDCQELHPAWVVEWNWPDTATWAHDFDFRIDQYGWSIGSGTWEAGLGIVNDTVTLNRMDTANAEKGHVNPPAAPGDTLLKYARVESGALPTGITSLYSWNVFKIVDGAQYVGSGLPVQSNYEWSWPDGVAWPNNKKFVMFGGKFEAVYPAHPEGQHITSRLVIAGSGTDPFPDHPNLIA